MVQLQLKGSALLAGRKLLLADDSVTIQKVIDLTFADEGVRVFAFNNGQEAIEHLEEVAPDIVLADVFMPKRTGYEVCEYVKENEKLKHIPVMLLVGSFEPFDETEARRVGADDILTKPFQSIRRLIDRVGALVSGQPAERDVATAELETAEQTTPDEDQIQEDKMKTRELEKVTADTLEMARESASQPTQQIAEIPVEEAEEQMETGAAEPTPELQLEPDGLLDLGELEPRSIDDDDFVLDLDTDLRPRLAPTMPLSETTFVEPQISEFAESVATQESYQPQPEPEYLATATAQEFYQSEPAVQSVSHFESREEIAYEDQVHEVAIETEQFSEVLESNEATVVAEEPVAEPAVPLGATSESLSPEMIDIIARRAVELLSDKVVREIAWEVVPELAELMIRRQLEEKESQPK
jgi:CheY-like chemotaxis protein